MPRFRRGETLRERIRALLDKPARAPASLLRQSSKWTEYERLLIGEASRRGENVYHVALHLDSGNALSAPAFELARKALEGVGRLLALSPQDAKASEAIRFIEAALSSSHHPIQSAQRCHVPSVVEKLSIEKLDAPQAAQNERDALQVLLEAEAAAVSARTKPSYSVRDDKQGRKASRRDEFARSGQF